MKKTTVKEIMVPLEEYPTVPEEFSVYEAVITLEKAQDDFDKTRYAHRAILVYDGEKRIVGKVSQWDLIRSLEPKYEGFGDMRSTSLSGLSPLLIKSMMESSRLWQDNLDFLCHRVAGKKVKDIMYRPTEGEKVDENATLGEALHTLILGHHQSLLVTREKNIVGVLRLTDMFRLISERIKLCGIKEEKR
ncbi:MAG: CBS domain-containing protein [Deltaproteobacteria bacterium]|nr:CBS domain-containing protein [Deltaproteobacteria bacterium]